MLSLNLLYDGLIYSGGFAAIILVSVLINPRIWLQDFPDELKKDIPPKTRKESRQTFITGFVFAMFIIGFPLYSVAGAFSSSGELVPFLTLFLHSFYVMMICNVLYWLLFHILIFNVIISRIRTVPGLKQRIQFTGWKNQLFGLFVGVLSCLLISGFVAMLAGFFL
ncbi:hypothetical protein [Spirochaeta isovalerica]|uniref:Tetrahydromethanopterin S-methyltransferase subunit F n=1 Tax=Spirochaeta isovalerica TaxID=150 RepID=A0A841R7J2_9SPIO|nr:hypothetical protein [Spirochaeta isovalerica]MBB6478462.1 tetrahydromethanopterin S-methyltransferase subunit F [Spirochaeta isovalerica]